MENFNPKLLPQSMTQTPADEPVAESDRRKEPRYVPYDEKSVLLIAPIQATVRNESLEGACLRAPISVEVEPNQEVYVVEKGQTRRGQVRWTTVDESGPYRVLGLHWLDT